MLSSILETLTRHNISFTKKSKTKVIVFSGRNRMEMIDDLCRMFSMYDPKLVPSSYSSLGILTIGNVGIIVKAAVGSNPLQYESYVIGRLNTQLCQLGKIDLWINDKCFNGIVGVRKTNGTPKSDFELIDDAGYARCFVSHKKGNKASDFQQWSGMTHKSIATHPEVISFIEEIKSISPRLKKGDSFYRPIECNRLKTMAMFGHDVYDTSNGPDNVNFIIQGDPVIVEVDGRYTIQSYSIHDHSSAPDASYEPVLAVTYRADRSNFGITNARFSIYPKGGRKFKQVLPLIVDSQSRP